MGDRRTSRWNVAFVFALALGAAALGSAADDAGAASAAGAKDAAPGNVRPRIVSLSPHLTELLFAAGAGDFVVGVDDASDYPAAVAGIARLGEPAALDVEALLRLKPTLVMLWDSGTPPSRRAELERLHLKLYVTDQHHLDDIGAALLEFGRLAGTQEAAAAAARRYRNELAQLRAQYAGRPRLSVFYQIWDRPLYTLSGAHVVSEVLSLCGGDNVFAELSTLAPAVDREAVIARNPEVIVIAAAGAEGDRQSAEWGRFSGLRAAREQHVFTVDPTLLGRMGPRILEGARAVCTLLDRARGGAPRSDPPRPGPMSPSAPSLQ